MPYSLNVYIVRGNGANFVWYVRDAHKTNASTHVEKTSTCKKLYGNQTMQTANALCKQLIAHALHMEIQRTDSVDDALSAVIENVHNENDGGDTTNVSDVLGMREMRHRDRMCGRQHIRHTSATIRAPANGERTAIDSNRCSRWIRCRVNNKLADFSVRHSLQLTSTM